MTIGERQKLMDVTGKHWMYDPRTERFATWDGDRTVTTCLNSQVKGERSDLPVTARFGGGHLSVPFWSGSENHPGDVAELIVFDRRLDDSERESIEAYLAEKYGIRCRRQWK